MKPITTLIATIALTSGCHAQSPSIIGDWIYEIPAKNGICIERYSYRHDGTFSTLSGKEALSGTYTIEPLSFVQRKKGMHYRMRRTVMHANGKKDCSEHLVKEIGIAVTVYLYFDLSNQLWFCMDSEGDKCIGPVIRQIAKQRT